ncbi:hypothetical protein M011DRAFT_226784 [Sporormia fimetaria CBS 119925]|uniref:Uncharacterized protein n=1 Tax=Sporormia fimetaria CBS 119925 TaxID=1340428 RepID=A0A6A6UY62_9PLEO|nr:hypothetical protein M011DRAFT_226784 [Sporormia fimetaria CBS 119925]
MPLEFDRSDSGKSPVLRLYLHFSFQIAPLSHTVHAHLPPCLLFMSSCFPVFHLSHLNSAVFGIRSNLCGFRAFQAGGWGRRLQHRYSVFPDNRFYGNHGGRGAGSKTKKRMCVYVAFAGFLRAFGFWIRWVAGGGLQIDLHGRVLGAGVSGALEGWKGFCFSAAD